MNDKHKLSELPPLPFGRISRIPFDIGTLVAIAILGSDVLGAVGILLLAGLGVSFVIGGLLAGTPVAAGSR